MGPENPDNEIQDDLIQDDLIQDDQIIDYHDPRFKRASHEAYDDDLTTLVPDGAAGQQHSVAAGPAVGEPIDESFFEEVMGGFSTTHKLDEIDLFLDELLAEPDYVPQTDLDHFSEPVLLCLGRKRIEATLSNPFCPTHSTVNLHASDNCPQTTYDLQELDYLGLVGKPEQLSTISHTTVTEHLETFGGRSEKVEVPIDQDFESGIFCISSVKDSRYQYLFFPVNNIRIRYQAKLIGEIFLEKEMLSKADLENTLAKQKKIRALRSGQILDKLAKLPAGTVDKVLRTAWRENPGSEKKLAGKILVESGIVTQEQVDESLKIQKKFRSRKIGDMLVEDGHITEDQAYSALADKFRKPFVNLAAITPSDEANQLLPRELIVKLMVLPLSIVNGRLLLATSRPDLPQIADHLRRHLSCPFDLSVASPSQLKSALMKRFGN